MDVVVLIFLVSCALFVGYLCTEHDHKWTAVGRKFTHVTVLSPDMERFIQSLTPKE